MPRNEAASNAGSPHGIPDLRIRASNARRTSGHAFRAIQKRLERERPFLMAEAKIDCDPKLARNNMTPNNTLERTVAHRGRPMLAMDCGLAKGAMAVVAGRSTRAFASNNHCHMNHSDFRIGIEFWCGGQRWRCTDVGSRVVVAISLEPHEVVTYVPSADRSTLGQFDRYLTDDPSWLVGPRRMPLSNAYSTNTICPGAR